MFAPVSWYGSEVGDVVIPYSFISWPTSLSANGTNNQGATTEVNIQWLGNPGDVRFFTGNAPSGSFSTFGSFTPADTDPDLEVRFNWTKLSESYSAGGSVPPGIIAEPSPSIKGVWQPIGAGSLSAGFGINNGSLPSGTAAGASFSLSVSLRNLVTGSTGSRNITMNVNAENGPLT